MRKETLVLILLECLLCLAQNGPPPMGPMGPMGMPIDMNFQQLDQIVGAPPTPPTDEEEKHFQGYYLTEEQNLGAPLDIPNEQHYQEYEVGAEGPQFIDQQMVGGPLDAFLQVKKIINFSFWFQYFNKKIIFATQSANPDINR